MPPTQTTRTNHLGYDVGASHKIPDEALELRDRLCGGGPSQEDIRAAFSYWDEVGDGKPKTSALKCELVDTVLVDAAWLAQLADAGGILPRCQDLPEGARVTLEEMKQWRDNIYGTLGVLVISYPWLDADHPDKDGLQLRAISHVLKLFDQEAKEEYGAGCKVGVFLDYVSMPQRSRRSAKVGKDDRTPGEKAIFDKALKAINRWYAHPKTHVLLVDTELPAGAHTNTQPYAGRGWCVMEYNASGLVKTDSALISLKGLTGQETSLDEVRKNGKATRAPPVAPAPFASTLEARVASGATTFTNKGDVPKVAKIYGDAFAEEMGAVVALSYAKLGWIDVQMRMLCAALRAAHADGRLRRLETLELRMNQMGDGAAAALAALLKEGAMPNLKELDLGENRVSNDGVAALASALRGGAVPSCTYINLDGNPGSGAPVDEALASPEREVAVTLQNTQEMAAVVELPFFERGWDDAQMLMLCEALRAAHADGGLRRLETLSLHDNQMGDGAAAALAALLKEGAMPDLKTLRLGSNQISNAGVAALASALQGGALPSCTGIDLDSNHIADAGVAALASALRGGALPACMLIGLSGNQIADRGVAALTSALGGGALPACMLIGLSGNQIGDDGVAALASALEGGALPACTEIHLSYNQISNDGVAALASALRGGALPYCTYINLDGNPGSGAPVDEALESPERAAALARRQAE